MSKLYLGVKKVDITPKIGCRMIGYMPDLYSEEIHDTLDATAFVFRSGDHTAVLISATVCVIHKDVGDAIRNQIKGELGIADVMVCATHTHSGPATGAPTDWDYCNNIFIPRIVEAVKQANADMQPVTVGYACGESLVGINRRERTMKNKVELGQNPWGPIDPRMTVITFRNGDGKIAATLIHYGAHATASGLNHTVSQDWPGVMVRRIEALTGATAAFVNGALGDVGPRLTCGKTLAELSYAMELGGVAAQDAARVLKKVTLHTDCDMKSITTDVKLPVKKRMPLKDARERLAACVDSKYSSDITIRNHYEAVVNSYTDESFVEQEYRTTEQTVLRIGNLVFLSFGYELFCEISLRIQKDCKDLVVLPVTNVNRYDSYFPSQSELSLGGYEIQMFQTENIQEFVDDVDYHLICETLKNIEKVR